jgi:hypothetical protein
MQLFCLLPKIPLSHFWPTQNGKLSYKQNLKGSVSFSDLFKLNQGKHTLNVSTQHFVSIILSQCGTSVCHLGVHICITTGLVQVYCGLAGMHPLHPCKHTNDQFNVHTRTLCRQLIAIICRAKGSR